MFSFGYACASVLLLSLRMLFHFGYACGSFLLSSLRMLFPFGYACTSFLCSLLLACLSPVAADGMLAARRPSAIMCFPWAW